MACVEKTGQAVVNGESAILFLALLEFRFRLDALFDLDTQTLVGFPSALPVLR